MTSYLERKENRSPASVDVQDKIISTKSYNAYSKNAHSDGERSRHIRIIFKDCNFTYKPKHVGSGPAAAAEKKQHSTLGALKNKIFYKVEKVRDIMTDEKMYEGCHFYPSTKKDKVKHFVHSNVSEVRLGFIDCKFIERRATLVEKLVIRFRKLFGLMSFEQDKIRLNFLAGLATVDHCKFRLKDMRLTCDDIAKGMNQET